MENFEKQYKKIPPLPNPDIKPNWHRYDIIKSIDQLPQNTRLATIDDFKNAQGQYVSGIPFVFQYFFPTNPNEYFVARSVADALTDRDDTMHHALDKNLVWVALK